MTLSPFYMGNQVEPQIPVDPEGYVKNENWGGQINFMIPLDGGIVERCKAAADRQIEKMQLNYELVRIDNCTKFMQRGFMLKPNTRVSHICSDIMPIAVYTKQLDEAKANVCPIPPKPWYKPWYKPKPKCETMSTLQNKIKAAAEADKKAAETKKTTTKTTTKK
jgi:hypothetical protein